MKLPPKCPYCEQLLLEVFENEYNTYVFNSDSGTYKKHEWKGDMEIRCPNCNVKLDIFPEGLCNYVSKNNKETKLKKWKSWNCHDCGVKEGEIHQVGCDMEICPKCHKQLITCGCFKKRSELPFRIPYILAPFHCGLCGEQWPELFTVPDEEWKKYVIPNLQREVLCRDCYEQLKQIFPKGWRNVRDNYKR